MTDFQNVSLSVSVSSNALTVALKDSAGADPSGGSPCVLNYRDANPVVGALISRNVTAANSITVPSGATLGTINNMPFWLYFVIFDDAGTQRLGVILASKSGNFSDLKSWRIASSALMGAGSISAQTFYTDIAVSSKPYVVLGRASWEAGLPAAGMWSVGPSRLEVAYPGMPLPGDALQSRQAAFTVPESSASIFYVDTQTSVSITPRSAANWIGVEANSELGQSSAYCRTNAIFMRGGTPLGQSASLYFNMTGYNAGNTAALLSIIDAPGTTGLTTYTVAIKTQSPGSVGWGGSGTDDGATISATEIQT